MFPLKQKYKEVLPYLSGDNKAGLATLLEISVNYINYKFSDENINFKVTSCYLTTSLYSNYTSINKKIIYYSIDQYHKYYTNNFSLFLIDNGNNLTDQINKDFVEEYIKNNE